MSKHNLSFEAKSAFWMTAPALSLLGFFMVLPFLLAVIFSFTNQRLTDRNSADFIGMKNYDRLLSIKVMIINAEKDSAGVLQYDDLHQPKFPKLRHILRSKIETKEYKELWYIQINPLKKIVIVAKDPIFYKSLLNTLWFVIMVVPMQCGLALILALLINKEMKGRNFFRTLFFLPVVTSMVVVSILWQYILQKDGVLNLFIHGITFGLFPEHWDWLGSPLTAMFAIALLSSWQGAGYQMLIFLAGLQGISKDLYEASSIDGADSYQQFWHITWPGLKNTMTFVLISTTMLAFSLYTQIAVLTRGGPQDSTQTLIYHTINKATAQQQIGYGSTISVVYFLIILVIALMQRALLDKKEQ